MQGALFLEFEVTSKIIRMIFKIQKQMIMIRSIRN